MKATASGPRPDLTLRVRNAAVTYARQDSGEIMASRKKLAEDTGTAVEHISRAMTALSDIAPLTVGPLTVGLVGHRDWCPQAAVPGQGASRHAWRTHTKKPHQRRGFKLHMNQKERQKLSSSWRRTFGVAPETW
jgi:hypothetical protein